MSVTFFFNLINSAPSYYWVPIWSVCLATCTSTHSVLIISGRNNYQLILDRFAILFYVDYRWGQAIVKTC